MYRVLLVEDEILERENTRESWIWKTGEFELCFDAANGREAWEKLQEIHIDILVTDIKMPFMDGLELSRLVGSRFPHIKIIILSGYSDFAYAQKAISLGVVEYIVKPIKSIDLLEAMHRVGEQIQKEQLKEKDVQSLREQAERNKQLQIFKLLDDLALGIYNEKVLMERAKILGLNLKSEFYEWVIIQYSSQKYLLNENDYLLSLDIQSIVYPLANKYNIFAYHKDLKEIFFIFQGDSKEQLHEKILHFTDTIKNELSAKDIKCRPIFAAGNICSNISGIPESFATANTMINFKYLFSGQDLIFTEQRLPAEFNKSFNDVSFNIEKNLIENLLKFGNKSDIQPNVSKVVANMKSIDFNNALNQYAFAGLINTFKAFLNELGEDDPESTDGDFGELFQVNNWVKWSNDIETFGRFLSNIIYKIIEIRDHKKNYKFVNVIAVAKKYIDENYKDPNLNLNDIALRINISSSYLSTLFNQETGENLIEYLTRLRINKAKELLKTTTMLVTDVAYEVGYQDSNYFSKIFKKITNLTPREYRS